MCEFSARHSRSEAAFILAARMALHEGGVIAQRLDAALISKPHAALPPQPRCR